MFLHIYVKHTGCFKKSSLPIGKLSYNDKLRMQMLWQVSHGLVYAEQLS